MSGNDVYPAPCGRCSFNLNQFTQDAQAVVRSLQRVTSRIIILGPLPRIRFDLDRTWEQCPAYHAERAHFHDVGSWPDVQFISLGRLLTKMARKRNTVVSATGSWFADDGIHLSASGYAKVLRKVPAWLKAACDDDE